MQLHYYSVQPTYADVFIVNNNNKLKIALSQGGVRPMIAKHCVCHTIKLQEIL